MDKAMIVQSKHFNLHDSPNGHSEQISKIMNFILKHLIIDQTITLPHLQLLYEIDSQPSPWKSLHKYPKFLI